MKYVMLFLSSMLDFSSIMVFILSVFSFRPKLYIKQMLLSAFIISVISVLLFYSGLRSIAPLIQISCMIISFIFLFKQKIIYSAWIVVFGYIISGLLQAALVGLLLYNKVIELNEMQPFQLKGYEMILTVDVILFILSALLKNRYGFEFEENYNGKPVKTKSRVFWTVLFAAIILSCVTGALMLFHMTILTLVVFVISLLLFIIVFTLYSNIRNKEEFDV